MKFKLSLSPAQNLMLVLRTLHRMTLRLCEPLFITMRIGCQESSATRKVLGASVGTLLPTALCLTKSNAEARYQAPKVQVTLNR